MQKEGAILVRRAGNSAPRRIRPESVRRDDLILEGDMRYLNYADSIRGLRRVPIRTEFKRDTDRLVYVERTFMMYGAPVKRRMWVAGDNVKPEDTVIYNKENVRPYRYAPVEPKLKPKEPCKTVRPRKTRHRQLLMSLLAELTDGE